MDLVETLTSYAGIGLAVFPLHGVRNSMCGCGRPEGKGPGDCHSPAKHPLLGLAHGKDDPLRATCHGECGRLGHGLYDATTDMGLIAEWLGQYPGCNWGIRPPVGVLVLDIDPRNGGDDALDALEHKHGALPPTLTARTGSGGWHRWLTYNGPARGKLCTGVDVKTNKGYLVAPPSQHISGGTYEWIDQSPAAYAPDWVKAIMNPPIVHARHTGGGGGLDTLVKFVSESTEGERNARLYWAACRAHERGVDPQPLVDAAVAVGLVLGAALATVRSAANAAPRPAATQHPTVAAFMRRTAGSRNA